MKAAVYNRFWHSMGGGERHSGMIAQILSKSGCEVDLIGHSDVSLEDLGSRLALDLSATSLRVVPDRGLDDMSAISAEYDLFINGTYMSRVHSRARHSAYVCYFPTPFDHELSVAHKAALRVIGPYARPLGGGRFLSMTYGNGWFPPEGGARRQWTWSNGRGVLLLGPGPAVELGADFGRPGTGTPVSVSVTTNGAEVAAITVTPEFERHTVVIAASHEPREVQFSSDTFSPGAGDTRDLGFALSRLRQVGTRQSPGERLGQRFPWLLTNPRDFSFVDTYDVILANSSYTQDWIKRLWNADSDILFPPIDTASARPQPTRERVILTVGRFFAPGHGHSKRQLEMVRMFGDIVASGQLPDWKLVVVGGCEEKQRPYLEAVTAAAAGLPVEIHANAKRSLVEELMSTASIFWSATGLGENTDKRPWTNEHFGMTTAEAMAGGCVPVVIDRAGQREIVREGVDGFRWATPEQLRIRTVQVATDDALRARLAASSMERASDFSDEAFAKRWVDIAQRHSLLTGH